MKPHRRARLARSAWLLLSLVSAAALSAAGAACGGDDAAPADDAATHPDATGADAAPARPGAGAGAAAPSPDTTADEQTASRPPQQPSTSDTTVWSTAPIAAPPAGRPALLRAVRTARHGAYDRIVFEFADHIPGFDVRYRADPPQACGSGFEVDVEAPQVLTVQLRTAAAHDDQGRATITERTRSPELPVLRTARITCDFEGVVEWALGVTRRAPLRVLELVAPPRLVVDLAHR